MPVVELWPFAEDEGDAEGDDEGTSEEEGSVAGSHGENVCGFEGLRTLVTTCSMDERLT